MADPVLPPSKFGAGYTVGAAPAPAPAPMASLAYASSTHDSVLTRPPIEATTGETNRSAVLSFVLVLLLGPLAVPFTLPLAFVARQQINHSDQGGAGLAKAAILIGYVYLALGITVVGLHLYLAGATGTQPM